MKKTAVILFNLGGPDRLEAVRPFLFNLFNDAAIIRLPKPMRFMIAALISKKREPTAKAIYARLGGGSPILKNTKLQAETLEEKLGNNFKCFIAMRYWHPFVEDIVEDIKNYAPDNLILLPLYPQFSTTTTASSLKSFASAAQKANLIIPAKTVCCYPTQTGFIAALAEAARQAYQAAQTHGAPRVLFSAHGLPEKIIASGDPYAWQCRETVKALVEKLDIPDLDYTLCYQSRVGPLKWIGPATDDEVRRAGQDKKPVVMVPIAFVSEHSETLVELDIEYRHLAGECGVPHYGYVPTVSVNGQFISGLAELVLKAQDSEGFCLSERECPKNFKGCCKASRPLAAGC